jgi:hypothetical protein
MPETVRNHVPALVLVMHSGVPNLLLGRLVKPETAIKGSLKHHLEDQNSDDRWYGGSPSVGKPAKFDSRRWTVVSARAKRRLTVRLLSTRRSCIRIAHARTRFMTTFQSRWETRSDYVARGSYEEAYSTSLNT